MSGFWKYRVSPVNDYFGGTRCLDPLEAHSYGRRKFLSARLAQSVEQLTFNQWVTGSIPVARTNDCNDLGRTS